jgi:hypothetical protein
MVVVEVLEGLDAMSDFVDWHRRIGAGIELVAPCAVATFDGAVEFGRSRRQAVKGQVLIGAGLFELGHELGHELGAAIDLDGFDGIEHLFEDGRKSAAFLAVARLHGLATVHLAKGS